MLCLLILLPLSAAAVTDPVPPVNLLVGTGVHRGALEPAACLPYSMVKLPPDTTRSY